MKNLITIIFFLFVIVLTGCNLNTRQKPNSVPSEAKWIGGVDGGVWVQTKEKIQDGQYLIIVYSDAGKLWVQDTFKIEKRCQTELPDSIDIIDLMSGFDGKDILLKIRTSANENCRLIGSKER